MKQINLLYSFPSIMGIPGVGITAWNQACELSKRGVSVHISTFSLEKRIEGCVGLNETFKLFGHKIPRRFFSYITTAALHDISTANYLKKNKNLITAIHCWPLGSRRTLRTAKEFGIKTFLERPNSHTGYAFEVVEKEYNKIGLNQDNENTHTFNAKHLAIEEEEYNLADVILCPSDFVAKTFIQKGFDEKKLAYHHYGYDPSIYYQQEENDNDDLNVIFIGRCEPRKGLHYALDAWLKSNASKNGKFYICGTFAPGYQELLHKQLSHKSIVNVGYTTEVTKYLQKSDALILPTIEEGSALVTYEAMACGNTLLISDSSGAHAEHMKDSLIHKTGDVNTLREHIDLLQSDKIFKKSLQKNSLEKAKLLTWGKSAEKLIDIYTKQTID